MSRPKSGQLSPPPRLPAKFNDAVAAIIVVDDDSYLLQLRDNIPGIWYPGYWGLFGGSVDAEETADLAIKRELAEELNLSPDDIRYFSEFAFDLQTFGQGQVYRRYYEIRITSDQLSHLRLGEGAAMRRFKFAEVFLETLVPVDSFCLWLHFVKMHEKDVVEIACSSPPPAFRDP